MSYTVALTGGIGSGKSTVANAFARHGVEIIDADVIARQVVEPGQPALKEIATRFGSAILHTDGTLNRAALRQTIFSSPADKAWLNQLLHPLIHAETRRQLKAARSPWCLWVVPLLVENQLEKQADRVLVVDVDPAVQIERTMARDRISREQAEKIIAAQATRAARLAVADDIIENSGHPSEVLPLVAELNQRYLALAKATKQD
ncbi:MAG: dephospho-CoA kinase [Mixta sp.]